MTQQGDLRLRPVGLKWHEVRALHHIKKVGCSVVNALLTRMFSHVPLQPLLLRWANREFQSLATSRPSQAISFFVFLLASAMSVFGARLEMRIPANACSHRLHDWVEFNGLTQHASSYFVCTGSWDGLLAPTTNYAVMREAIQIYRAKFQYQRSKVYERLKALAQEDKAVWRNQIELNNQKRIDDYFERFVALFRSIQAHGVLPVNSLKGPLADKFQPSASRKRKTEWGERDIGVAIGPDGQLVLLPGGKHRLAVATVLKIPRIPVQVRMVHVDWLRQLPRNDDQSWVEAIVEGINGIRRHYAPADEAEGQG
jgi:hypothetical protein